MIFKPERIARYKKLMLKHYGKNVSDEEATEGLTRLVEVFSILNIIDSKQKK